MLKLYTHPSPAADSAGTQEVIILALKFSAIAT